LGSASCQRSFASAGDGVTVDQFVPSASVEMVSGAKPAAHDGHDSVRLALKRVFQIPRGIK
jgi:hypothetical protein